MSIVARIKNLSEQRGLNIKQIEQSMGFANGSIRRWDSNSPAADKLLKLAYFLNVSCEYLLTGEEKESRLSAEDAEWLALIHQLPVEAQYEFRGEIKGYLKRINEETAADVGNMKEAK